MSEQSRCYFLWTKRKVRKQKVSIVAMDSVNSMENALLKTEPANLGSIHTTKRKRKWFHLGIRFHKWNAWSEKVIDKIRVSFWSDVTFAFVFVRCECAQYVKGKKQWRRIWTFLLSRRKEKGRWDRWWLMRTSHCTQSHRTINVRMVCRRTIKVGRYVTLTPRCPEWLSV